MGTLWFIALLAAPAPVRVPVAFHVPTVGGTPVVDAPWLDLRIQEANRVFEPHGVRFERVAVLPRAQGPAAATRADRDALAAHQRPGVVNVHVVTHLMDIHQAGRPRQGVHWKVREAGRPRRTRFVILAAYSSPGVLGHELGHYLGQAPHSDQPDNLMSYTRTGQRAPFLTDAQGRRMRATARRLLRQGVLAADKLARPMLPESGATNPRGGTHDHP